MEDQRLEVLERYLKEQIEGFQGRRRQHWLRTYVLKLAIIVLSALITITVGIKGIAPGIESWFLNCALVLSAAVSALASWEGFANYR
jgi:hypothetical protein